MNNQRKTCLITGATAGIGKATALELARKGLQVVIVGRSAAKIAQTVEEIRITSGNTNVEGLEMDLSSLAQVRHGVADFQQRFSHLDVLINNAGLVTSERQLSADGYELQLAVNYLAPFLLTHLLMNSLKARPSARIINVSSIGHAQGQIHFDDLQFERTFHPRQAYYQTRLAMVLFTYALARRLEGTALTANCLHPGIVRTQLSHGYMGNPIFRFFESMISVSPSRGAATSVYLALSPEVNAMSGCYFIRQRAVESSLASYDQTLQERLWDISRQLVQLD